LNLNTTDEAVELALLAKNEDVKGLHAPSKFLSTRRGGFCGILLADWRAVGLPVILYNVIY
jgi:dihydrodipicolinate synthase/N-acetylneuraminate lyase